MRVVVLVPRREDNGRRDHIWHYVRTWLIAHHPDYEIFEGYDDGEVFSMAKARNDASRRAGDWDTAIILDSDTIAPPDVLEAAVQRASLSLNLVVAGDIRMCMDKPSTDRILAGGPWFPRPDGRLAKTGTGASDNIYAEPSSGVMCVSRRLWDRTGGYIECLKGWGYEDLAFMAQCNIFGDGTIWQPDGILLHFWHERTRITEDCHRNHQVWEDLSSIASLTNAWDLAAKYLMDMGHTWQ